LSKPVPEAVQRKLLHRHPELMASLTVNNGEKHTKRYAASQQRISTGRLTLRSDQNQ